jgi:hydroxymethylbilane synthase
VRIGTRGSALALAQARLVAERLDGAGSDRVEIVVLSTSGDESSSDGAGGDAPDRPALDGAPTRASISANDKSRWVDAIEAALLEGRIDLAVHSAKDVPAQLAEGLVLIGCPARADARDTLCGAASLAELAPGARVGTSSLRRTAQLRALRDDVEPVELRGNVDTRLRRLAEGHFDAIVLARAGLERLASQNQALSFDLGCPLDQLVPAAGQGTLVLQARTGDGAAAGAVTALRDPHTERTLTAERSLVTALGADCTSAMGAHARIDGTTIELRAWIGVADGSAWISDRLSGEDPEQLGREVAERMLAMGAAQMLSAGEIAGTGAGADD